MESMHWKSYPSINKSSHLEVEPAFRIAFVLSTFGIAGSPDAIVIIGCSYDSSHITGIKLAVEKNLWFSRFWELKMAPLRERLLGEVLSYFHLKQL